MSVSMKRNYYAVILFIRENWKKPTALLAQSVQQRLRFFISNSKLIEKLLRTSYAKVIQLYDIFVNIIYYKYYNIFILNVIVFPIMIWKMFMFE